jgi:hypothetical protein
MIAAEAATTVRRVTRVKALLVRIVYAVNHVMIVYVIPIRMRLEMRC